MAIPVPLAYGGTYHVFNRGDNQEDTFREDPNYRHLLDLYARRVAPIADTFAYCILRNPFHFLLRIRDEEDLTGLQDLSGLPAPSRRFSSLFNAYARAVNSAYHRTGALFQRPFGRHEVSSEVYFQWLAVYIHRDPEKHGLVGDFRAWPYSSYQAILSFGNTRIRREDVLERLGGRRELERLHESPVEERKLVVVVGDDD